MSNPARPPKEPLSAAQVSARVAPDAFFTPRDPKAYAESVRRARDLKVLQQKLEGLDMVPAPAIVLPKEHTVDEGVLRSNKEPLALAKTGKPAFRLRSAVGKGAVNAFFSRMPEETGVPAFSRGVAAERIGSRFVVDAGAEMTVGRLEKAYPKMGSRPSEPPTRGEARSALAACGLDLSALPAGVPLRPFPLISREGDPNAVTINPRSDNGFPVLGKWDTPGAAQKVFGLAQSLRRRLEQAAMRGDEGVWKFVREAEERVPWMMAFRGKAKADVYSGQKVEERMLRFYNALPRQVMLNMQVASQPLEQVARHVGSDPSLHTGIGMSLVRGGADALVAALDAQLAECGLAYVHVGDDSWVVRRDGEHLELFSVDCSNFDITQHAATTLPVHECLRAELRKFDGPAADLWFALARERLVVVAASVVRRFKHAGPSGMPLQSKVNDMLMEVFLRRLCARSAVADRAALDDSIKREGAALGFDVRLEDWVRVRAGSLREALTVSPFLFVGYYFHVLEGEVTVYADVPRALAQMPYPAGGFVPERSVLRVLEAARLGNVFLSLGEPPACLEASHEALRAYVLTVLEAAREAAAGVAGDRVRQAILESPFGEQAEPSVAGLMRAVARPARLLWRKAEPLRVRLARNLSEEPLSWADEVDREEADEAASVGLVLGRPAARAVAAAAVRWDRPVPTHPVTRRNDGRPPPTVVWGPPKAPRERAVASTARGRRRDGIAAREFQEMLEEEDEDDDGSEFSDWD